MDNKAAQVWKAQQTSRVELFTELFFVWDVHEYVFAHKIWILHQQTFQVGFASITDLMMFLKIPTPNAPLVYFIPEW